ncbi:MAG TPA: efflux RND transporter periplasmic adaptor subunit [Steroidobacteraceae bacterium]|nr:efflux RND transporter periplasmic adaptor subunit [Steroidobacteraceae bacterium]
MAGCGGQGGRPPGGMTPQVAVVTLKPQPVTLTRELPGRISAFLVAEVRPQVSGIVKRRLFTEGGTVKAGEPLYEIDDAIYRAQYNNARATLQKAQATLEAARPTARRAAEMVKIDAISAQDNDNAIAALGQAEADVAAAQAAVDSSAVNLAYAHIVSPISGRIGKSSVTQGALVTGDQVAALATVQQLDPVYVDVNQSSGEWLQLKQEIEAGRVQAGVADAPTKIVLENGATYGSEAKLQFTDVTVDPTTGNFLLRAIVANPNHVLMPGMFVRAIVGEGVMPQGLLAPQRGITRNAKGAATALVVDHDGKIEVREVKVSRTIGDQWLVEDGLAAGDRVVVEGLQKVQPGMAVKAVEAAPPVAAGEAGKAATAGPAVGASDAGK